MRIIFCIGHAKHILLEAQASKEITPIKCTISFLRGCHRRQFFHLYAARYNLCALPHTFISIK